MNSAVVNEVDKANVEFEKSGKKSKPVPSIKLKTDLSPIESHEHLVAEPSMSDTYSEKQTNIYCALLTGNQHSQSEPKDTKTREDNLIL